jgi:hypothetical protein
MKIWGAPEQSGVRYMDELCKEEDSSPFAAVPDRKDLPYRTILS